MMTGSNRQPVTDALRRYVMPHDERIAGLTGQAFGEDYFDGLLRDTGAVFDSEPPTTAVLAADTLAGRGLDLLKRDRLDADQRAYTRSGDFRDKPGGRLAGWSTAGGNWLSNPRAPQPFANCPDGSQLRPPAPSACRRR
ncbi:hypothetical protein G6F59_015749 [Rhizopus arrhizus]|nr:hypothetical protein G6F59_015749 [Rhizopus arrhizus]